MFGIFVIMTKIEIESLKVGDLLHHTHDTNRGRALPGARYSHSFRVVDIFARGVSVKGRAFACFYTDAGPNASISGSIAEGDEDYRLVRAEE